ncbi:hypothetical protein BX666DRAFT_584329 [Dichotomocladium elegans]|nr:hypothetical protein BX666DRAFT_584329 [Dichotomocladium elegans]
MLKLSFAKPIEPQLVLSFCPYMAYLHLGSFDWLPGSLEWSNRPIERGLRYLCLSNTSRSTTAFLSEHVATLEILHLPIVHLPISFPSRRLRVLSCDASQDRHGILDDLLLQGPSGIRELHLHHIIPTASLSRAIHRLAPTLTTLQLTVQYESDDMVLLEMLAFLPNLTTLSYQCQAISATKLETLAKVKSLQVLSVKSIEYAPLVSLTCLEELRVLRRIELWRMAYFSLEPLTHLEQLESIQLQWCVAPVGIRLLAEKAPRHLKKMGFEKCSAVSYEDIPDNVLVDRGISIVIE